MSEPPTVPWRVGTKVPLNIYAGDRPVCQCHSTEDAERIVLAVNRSSLVPAVPTDEELFQAANQFWNEVTDETPGEPRSVLDFLKQVRDRTAAAKDEEIIARAELFNSTREALMKRIASLESKLVERDARISELEASGRLLSEVAEQQQSQLAEKDKEIKTVRVETLRSVHREWLSRWGDDEYDDFDTWLRDAAEEAEREGE